MTRPGSGKLPSTNLQEKGLAFQGGYEGFPKNRGTILGVPIIRTIVFWGLYWGSLILGNYRIGLYGFKEGAWGYGMTAVENPHLPKCSPPLRWS